MVGTAGSVLIREVPLFRETFIETFHCIHKNSNTFSAAKNAIFGDGVLMQKEGAVIQDPTPGCCITSLHLGKHYRI